ncbi:MAG: TraC family protein [Bacteriovoracia bacterium]
MIQLKEHLPKPIHDALAKKETFTKALFERPESLSALLPYDEYLEEEQIFQLKDGSLGAVFEASLLEHEPLTESHIMEAVRSVKSWFTLPENCVLQVLYEQSYISSLDREFEKLEQSYPNGHPIAKVLFQKRLEEIKNNCGKFGDRAPLRRRTYLSIRYFPHGQKKKGSPLFKRGEAVLHHEVGNFVRELRQFKHIVKNLQSNSKIALIPMGAAEVLDILRRFFNPKTYYKRDFAKYNSNIPMSDQFIFNNPTLDFSGIEREGIKSRTLSLKTSPQFAYPGGMAYFTRLHFPFKLSLTFSFPTKGKVKAFFDLKEFFLQNTPSAKARRQRDEILEVQDKLAREDRCLHLTFNVLVEGESEEILDSRTRDVLNIFHNDLECEAIVDEDIGLGLCLNALPLCYSPDSDYSAARYIRILRSDAINFIPIFDSYRGHKTPVQLFLSRENNLIYFNLLENQTSNHTAVLADSGSGKSAFVINCIQSVKRLNPEPLVFIIDKKSSYVMLSEHFEGDLTIFDRNKEMPFTPFRGFYDEEKIAFLTRFIISALKLTSPSFNVESEHQAAITRALKQAYLKKCDRAGLTYLEGELIRQESDEEVELTMEDFIAELGAISGTGGDAFRESIEQLIHKLRPFFDDGTYARFLKGKRSLKGKKSKLFYAYDLDALDGDPVLQSLMTMAVVEEIRRILSLQENKGRTAVIVFEEFAMLGRNNPAFKDFAIDFAETMRKRGCWLITLTPRPQNYFELEVGKAFWGVADNYVFLQMNPDNVDYVAKNSGLLDEACVEVVKSLKTINGKVAEVFYINKKGSVKGAFSFTQTDYDRWMSPTNAKDAVAADNALKMFEGRRWEALEYLVKKYPNGTEATEASVSA